ncbi:Ribosomal protein L22p/L17e family protein [Babesia bovis T2Bo]|uniref:Ribosomal protein L22p/L17e family protein n=1 Tax=Babesia bovis T2Bo TaxID=484906 RepID=UPI001D2AC84E|nr:Ribosomal protein L22p/L17e family protein [Babesia bovis T2Bo]EDO05684.2 Ribosomal protein L22p/L17e family protein [Babesia bovis T2Bo]
MQSILKAALSVRQLWTSGWPFPWEATCANHGCRAFSGLRNKNARIKNPYYRKKGFWEWRKKHIQKLNKARYKRQFLVPKVIDPEEEPVKGKHDANIWEFVVDGLPIGLKRLKLYTKLLTNLHLQDAIDWLYAMPTIRTNRILNSLSDAQKKIYEEYNGDPSRLYIDSMVINYKTPMKQIKYHALRNFGIMCTWRNVIVYRIREMPMNEFYQKIFILGRIPRSMGAEMRAAIYEKRVPTQTVVEWYPYLTAHSRFFFRKELKWLDKTGQFNYYKHRREWIDRYNANMRRKTDEMRRERGIIQNAT